MNVYLVAAKEPDEGLGKELVKQFQENFVLPIAPNQWFVSTRMTSREITDKLDPGKGGRWGEFLVVKCRSYSGWYDMDIWEWIEDMLEADPVRVVREGDVEHSWL